MKIAGLLRFLLCAAIAALIPLSAVAQTALGTIKAAKVVGDVLKLSAAGVSAPLRNGDVVVETDTVTTGKGASVVLVFANGSSVKVGAESRLAIDEFKMDPLAEEVKLSELTAEPSVSKTSLNLAYGEMVGDVKKLNTSSSYSIKTPVGAAGIRGTIYRIVFRPTADGKAFFTVSTAEGLVVMEGITTTDVPVAEGNEVVVEVDTNNPTNPTITTTEISPAATAAITEASVTITEALAETTIPPGPPPDPPPPPPPPPEDIPPPPPAELTNPSGGT
jgi:hypothetical protein